VRQRKPGSITGAQTNRGRAALPAHYAVGGRRYTGFNADLSYVFSGLFSVPDALLEPPGRDFHDQVVPGLMSTTRIADFGCNLVMAARTTVALVLTVSLGRRRDDLRGEPVVLVGKDAAEMLALFVSKPSRSRSGPGPCLQNTACVNA
jgi:hypothetical protein